MAANTSRATDFDALISTTLDNYRDTLTDNVFDSRPVFYWLNSKGRRRMLDGGATIVEPLIHAGGQASFYGEWDVLEIDPQEGISAATFDWGQAYASVVISGKEKRQNAGKSQVISLVEAKIMQAEETLKDLFSSAVNLDEVTDLTSTDAQGKAYSLYWHGLPTLINDYEGDAAANGGNGVTVGGIPTGSATNTFWQSKVYDGASGGLDIDTGEKARKAIRTAINESSDGGSDRVDAAFTSLSVFEGVEDSYLPQVRYQDVEAANKGFDTVRVSKVTLFWDFDAMDDTVFGVNSKYLQVVGHKDAWMTNSGFTKNPVDSTYSTSGAVGGARDAQYALITAQGQMTTRNRRRHFRINNIQTPLATA